MTNKTMFLLYVSVILIITYLQQEFVLLPELQHLDIVEEASKTQLLERWQKTRWLAFVIAPLVLLLRLGLVSLCLFVGGFFFADMTESLQIDSADAILNNMQASKNWRRIP